MVAAKKNMKENPEMSNQGILRVLPNPVFNVARLGSGFFVLFHIDQVFEKI